MKREIDAVNGPENNPINANRRALIQFGAASLLALAASGFAPRDAHAAQSLIYKGFASNKAVGGYDPVAYFTEGKPTKGSKKHRLEFDGADWYFASQANLELFKAEPEKYAPQFGGYCAYAVGIGQTAKGNPKNWDVVDGKLYLNYNRKFQKIWNKDQASFIERGNENWPSVVQ